MKDETKLQFDQIEYQELGTGPTLVLLHGFGGQPKQWNPVLTTLAKNYRVIIPNFSRLYVSAHSFKQQVQCLRNFLLKINNGTGLHLVASSYGGALSWGAAIETETLIDSLVLLSPMPPNPHDRFRSSFLKRLLRVGQWPTLLWLLLKLPVAKQGLQELAEVFQVPWLERKKQVLSHRQLKLLTHVINRFAILILREDWSYWESRLSFLDIPVCVIWGDDDHLYESTEPNRFVRLFNSGQLHRLEETGHFSMTENPLPVIYILNQFLNRFQKVA